MSHLVKVQLNFSITLFFCAIAKCILRRIIIIIIINSAIQQLIFKPLLQYEWNL